MAKKAEKSEEYRENELLSFGKLLAKLRNSKDPPLQQYDLAQLASTGAGEKLSAATIAALEGERAKVSFETALRIIDALDLTKETRDQLRRKAAIYLEEFREPVSYPTFSSALAKVLERLEVSPLGLMKDMFSPAMAQFVKAGQRLVSAEKLKDLVTRLRENGATPEEILKIHRAWTFDLIMTDMRLVYFSIDQREKIAKAAARAITEVPQS